MKLCADAGAPTVRLDAGLSAESTEPDVVVIHGRKDFPLTGASLALSDRTWRRVLAGAVALTLNDAVVVFAVVVEGVLTGAEEEEAAVYVGEDALSAGEDGLAEDVGHLETGDGIDDAENAGGLIEVADLSGAEIQSRGIEVAGETQLAGDGGTGSEIDDFPTVTAGEASHAGGIANDEGAACDGIEGAAEIERVRGTRDVVVAAEARAAEEIDDQSTADAHIDGAAA